MFRVRDDLALVQTVDFFPPIVDDPYRFGQIAAANALSDVYAMGGRPITALNIVGFPISNLPPSFLSAILRGGSDKVEEAGAVVVGGHSIKDAELKYGLAVTGLVHPDRFISNAGACPGDLLFLTKPLGTGLVTTAIKRDKVAESQIEQVIELMAALNRQASELMIEQGATAATDITGFGLLGHACEMADASAVTLKLFSDSLPLLDSVFDLVEAGMIPGGAEDNRRFMTGKWSVEGSVDERMIAVLHDPQTSGGLFVAIPEKNASDFAAGLKAADLPSRPVGQVLPRGKHPIIIR